MIHMDEKKSSLISLFILLRPTFIEKKNLSLAEVKHFIINFLFDVCATEHSKHVEKWQSRSSTSILRDSNWFIRSQRIPKQGRLFSLNRSLFPFSDAYPPASDIRFLLFAPGVEDEFILNPPVWWMPRDYFRENERGLRTISLGIHIFRSSSATTLGKNCAITVNRRTSREIGVN